ncbi:YgaP family membrane protein [Acidithiobacillus sp.]
MPVNEGKTDRIIRVIIGLLIILVLGIALPGTEKWWALVGLIPLITGIIGFCGLYAMFGIKTCPLKAGNKPSQR